MGERAREREIVFERERRIEGWERKRGRENEGELESGVIERDSESGRKRERE